MIKLPETAVGWSAWASAVTGVLGALSLFVSTIAGWVTLPSPVWQSDLEAAEARIIGRIDRVVDQQLEAREAIAREREELQFELDHAEKLISEMAEDDENREAQQRVISNLQRRLQQLGH